MAQKAPAMPGSLTDLATLDPATLQPETDAEYARHAQKLTDLKARARALEQRRSAINEGMNRADDRDVLTARAERLLADDVIGRPSAAEREMMRRDLGTVED